MQLSIKLISFIVLLDNYHDLNKKKNEVFTFFQGKLIKKRIDLFP